MSSVKPAFAIIGGSGLSRLQGLEVTRQEVVHTPFGETSAPLVHGLLGGKDLVFLARHGTAHTIPPHKVNYRANLWALRHIGIEQVVGVAAVGGIRHDMEPGSIAVPDQIVDYTWGRAHTFFEEGLTDVTHIDFTRPYCESLRTRLMDAAESTGLSIVKNGTYGATQGPRLETAMEINRMEEDGCDMVGMTGMPEAALARELELCYACCAVTANWAAGRSEGLIDMAVIEANLTEGMEKVRRLLTAFAQIAGTD